MALESSFLGLHFSQKQLKIRLMSSNKRFYLESLTVALRGRHRRETADKGKKYTSKPELLPEPERKNKTKDNKPYISAVLRHIFAIFSSQISTMMET